MISIERIYDYASLPSEKPMIVDKDASLPDWPKTGQIRFENVSLYFKKPGPRILTNISITIEDKDKIGIVGRTGAGKSTLMSVLFRLAELPSECGKVFIDQEDISLLGLKKLRSALSVIPQDPVLFMGSIRMNLDPFNEFNDDALWRVLESVELLHAIKLFPGQLDGSVSEGGSNLSVGQRQLLCMARALLKKTRIIVIDEATANIDNLTDQIIQTTLKTTFAQCTVLTIAHRINTIIDSDKILVMDEGKVEEFDHPHNLFRYKPTGIFCQMVQQTGPAEELNLRNMAELNFKRKEMNL